MMLKTTSFSLSSVPSEPWRRDLGGYADAMSVFQRGRAESETGIYGFMDLSAGSAAVPSLWATSVFIPGA